MHLYRGFLLRPLRFRIMMFAFICVIIAAMSQGLHDVVIHPRAAIAERQDTLAKEWINFSKAGDLDSEIRRGLLVRQILWELDGEAIGLHEQKSPWTHMGNYGHHTWLEDSDDKHPRIYACLASMQVVVVIPKSKPMLHWMNMHPSPVPMVYVVPGALLKQHITDIEPYQLKPRTADELGLIALGYIATFSPSFRARMDAIIADRPSALIAFDAFMHSTLAHVLVWLLVWMVLFGTCFDPGLQGLVDTAAEEFSLDSATRHRLFQQGLPFWLSHRSRDIIGRKLELLARSLYREGLREEKRKRSAQLRALADEQKSKELEELAQKRAKLAAQRIVSKQTTLSKEIYDLRNAIRGETSDIGRVIKEDFIAQVQEEVEDRQRPLNESSDAASVLRHRHLRTIQACTRELTSLESMKDRDLEQLSRVIRPMKRQLSREAFRSFIEQFDGNYDKTYRAWLDLALTSKFDSLEQSLLQKPELIASSDETVFEDPTLLKGLRVLIVGGIPRIVEFYTETTKSLGAIDVTYVHPDELLPTQRTNIDLILLFANRCSHTHQDQAKNMGVPYVYLERLTRSTFKRGLITALHHQYL